MSMHFNSLKILAVVSALAGLPALAALPAPAAARAAAQVTVRIEAKSLEDGLNDFARQTGLQVIFRSEQAQGRRTPAVIGTFAPEAALERLLSQSGGLSYRFVNARTIAIENKPPANRSGEVRREDITLARVQPDTDERQEGAAEAPQTSADELTVTGTRETGIVNQGVIPREENQAVRYNVITRDEIDRSGVTTMPELMRRLTINQEAGTTSQRAFQITVTGTGSILGNGDQVNLRGLGTNQTAILINGRRLYSSDSSNLGPDISRIPLSAVERIEVLPSSGSAIYGANSVGGVVNVILRQGYRATEASAYFGGSPAGGAGEYRIDLFHGLSFNDGRTQGNLLLNVQRFDDLQRSDRDYDERILASSSAAPGSFPYMSMVLPMLQSRQGVILAGSLAGLGVPSNPTALYAAIPAGSSGIGLTPDSFNATANVAYPSTGRIGRSKLRQESNSYQFMLNLEHAIRGDSLATYTELTYREDEMPLYYPAGNTMVILSATDPRNPFRNEVTPGFAGRTVLVYRDPADLPDSYQGTVRTTLRGVLGLKGKWTPTLDRSYHWALDTSWDRNESETEGRWSSFTLDAASRAGVYNIFRDLTGVGLMSEAEADKFRYDSYNLNKPTISAANFRLNGDLLPVWGGAATFSVGSEWRHEEYFSRNDYPYIGEYHYLPGGSGASLVPRVASNIDRQVFAMYGEVQVPLVGAANRMPGLYSLDLSAGMRYEKYDDFQAAKPPLYALKWGITPDVALRASFAEGFQAPTVGSLSPVVTTQSVSGAYTDPLRPGAINPGYTQYASGNPGLAAETAETWDVGIILTPRVLPGLSINASFFRLDKRGNIASLSLAQAIVSYPELVVRGAATADDIAANRPGAVTEFHNKPVNIARQFTDGIDVDLSYRLPARDWGQLTFLTTGTWTDRIFTQSRPGQPEVSSLAVAGPSGGATLKERITSTAIWNRGPLSASLTGSYTGKFEASTTTASPANPTGSGIDGDYLGGQWVMDAQFDYTVADGGAQAKGMRQWLGGTRWTVGVLNLFDTEPDLWTDSIRAFTTPFVDPRQRFVYLQLRKTF